MHDAVEHTAAPRSRRRGFQFSVRALLVGVLVLGAFLGWIVRRGIVQRQAVTAILRGGGSVHYDWEWPGFRVQPDGRWIGRMSRTKGVSRWPSWLIKRLGPDYFGRVTQVQVGPNNPDQVMASVARLEGLQLVNFSWSTPISDSGLVYLRELKDLKSFSTPIQDAKLTAASLESLKGLKSLRILLFTNSPPFTDADLVWIKDLTGLQSLQIAGSPRRTITDVGLVNLRDMVDMRELILIGTKITSVGLNNLRGMTRMTELELGATKVSDLAPIENMTRLESLRLASTAMTDAGLAPLARFTALETLALGDTAVTDAGLKSLRGLTLLKDLDLNKGRIGDAGLAELAGLRSLERLMLSGTRVNDSGLKHLSGMTSLQSLSLYDTSVTDEGLAHLAVLPKLESLNLGKTGITDVGLKRLTGMSTLSKLTLTDTRVTGAGLMQLARVPGLKQLVIKTAALAEKERDALESALPELKISEPQGFAPYR